MKFRCILAAAALAAAGADEARYESLLLDIQASYDWGVAKLSKPKFSRVKFYHKPKNLPLLTSNITEMVTLVRQGKLAFTSEFELRKVYATALAEPMDLRYYKEAVAAYDEAIRLAPDEKSRKALVTTRARYELKAAQVDPAGPAKVLEEVFASYTDAEKLERIGDFPGHDYIGSEGRALSEKAGPAALARWYLKQVEPRPLVPDDPLDPRNSFDRKLALCDEAAAKCPDQAESFRRAKRALWREMRAFGPWEKDCREALAKVPSDKPDRRCPCLDDLAAVLVARAERYSADPDEALSRQAIACWEEAAGLRPAAKRFQQAITQAFLIRDWKLAGAWLDRYAKFLGEKGEKDPWICGCRGDLACYAGDWAAAVKWYETPEKDFADGPVRVPYPNSHQRYAGALNAIGEYAKCLEALKKCPNFGSFRSLNAVNRKTLEARLAKQCKE